MSSLIGLLWLDPCLWANKPSTGARIPSKNGLNILFCQKECFPELGDWWLSRTQAKEAHSAGAYPGFLGGER